MKVVVPIKDILPNPYQARKKMDREAIRNLAEEIRRPDSGPGSLRGRMKGSHVELCYGHRRLAALKHLGWDKVEVEVDELTDEEMALQGLAENFQREGLSDIEKAQGLHTMVQLLIKQKVSESDAMKRVSKFVGLSEAWIRDLLSMLDMEGTVQRAIRDRKIAGRTRSRPIASAASRWSRPRSSTSSPSTRSARSPRRSARSPTPTCATTSARKS
jgi:ParB family chromosome partitioning protein